MTRSKVRKLKRAGAVLAGMPLAAALFSPVPAAYAQSAAQPVADTGGLEEIIVTAQKRTENLQDVPISITAIGTQQLAEMHVENFEDYMKLLPSTSVQMLGPGDNRVFMRGIATGDYPNHSGSLPSVGTYFDEQPLTTILGAIDVHVYDIQRVEALNGPQGTLYGASSEAGTIRIITNKPDPSGFSAAYDVEGNDVYNGTVGGMGEGYVNVPISSNAAVRLVGWYERDSGFIDNVPGTLTYPDPASDTGGVIGVINNKGLAKKHYNDVETYGGRAALKVNLGDSWSITPMLMSQIQESNGIFAEERVQPGFTELAANVGPYQVSHFLPESAYDDFTDAALTVEGKIGNIDVVYASSYMRRHNVTYSDYTDYSLAYSNYYNGGGAFFHDTSGNPVVPSQYIVGGYEYTQDSNELRITTPATAPLRFVGGLFQQRQQNHIVQNYEINGVGGDGISAGNGSVPSEAVTGWNNTWWLTDQLRVNRDWAAFGELSYDFIPKLTGSVGMRWFRFDNTLDGFYGFGINNPYGGPGSPVEGEQTCTVHTKFYGAPCEDATNPASAGNGTTPKFNLTYKIDEDRMVYGTISRGFRPGGANRVLINGENVPFGPDYLQNYEIGWKTSWLDHTLRFNGAVFYDKWENFQFNFLGPYSVTIVLNAGNARAEGVESELQWAPTRDLTFTANVAYTDAYLTSNYCGPHADPITGALPSTSCTAAQAASSSYNGAPTGTQLPTTPPVKGNLTARYSFPVGSYNAFAEGVLAYQDSVWSDLRPVERAILGKQPAFTTVDLTLGMENKSSSFGLFVKDLFNEQQELYRYAECTPTTCGNYAIYSGVATPRLIGIRYGQKF